MIYWRKRRPPHEGWNYWARKLVEFIEGKNMDQKVEPTHFIRIMCKEGDSLITWDPRDPASINEARAKFNELKASGHTFYHMNVVEENGIVVEEKGERIDEFDPQAGRLSCEIVAAPRLRGG